MTLSVCGVVGWIVLSNDYEPNVARRGVIQQLHVIRAPYLVTKASYTVKPERSLIDIIVISMHISIQICCAV